MIGTMSLQGMLTGRLSNRSARLTGRLGSRSARITGVMTIPQVIEAETYDGAYEVTPKAFDETVLETEHKLMQHDVTVLEIPYYETSNLSGGYTAIIGG